MAYIINIYEHNFLYVFKVLRLRLPKELYITLTYCGINNIGNKFPLPDTYQMREGQQFLSFVEIGRGRFVQWFSGRNFQSRARRKDSWGQVNIADVRIQDLGESMKPIAIHSMRQLLIKQFFVKI